MGTGVIGEEDDDFGLLRLWLDYNRNGVAEAGELVPLESMGVTAISLRIKESRRHHAWGNEFRYRAKTTIWGQDRYGYDVFLVWTPACR